MFLPKESKERLMRYKRQIIDMVRELRFLTTESKSTILNDWLFQTAIHLEQGEQALTTAILVAHADEEE